MYLERRKLEMLLQWATVLLFLFFLIIIFFLLAGITCRCELELPAGYVLCQLYDYPVWYPGRGKTPILTHAVR